MVRWKIIIYLERNALAETRIPLNFEIHQQQWVISNLVLIKIHIHAKKVIRNVDIWYELAKEELAPYSTAS